MKIASICLTAVLWCGLCAKTTVCFAQQSEAETRAKEEKLEAGIWEVGQAELNESHFGVNAECEKAIKEYIHQASAKLVREQPGKTLMAKKKFGILMREVIRQAKTINQKMIDRNTFEEVKALFCPGFAPFC